MVTTVKKRKTGSISALKNKGNTAITSVRKAGTPKPVDVRKQLKAPTTKPKTVNPGTVAPTTKPQTVNPGTVAPELPPVEEVKEEQKPSIFNIAPNVPQTQLVVPDIVASAGLGSISKGLTIVGSTIKGVKRTSQAFFKVNDAAVKTGKNPFFQGSAGFVDDGVKGFASNFKTIEKTTDALIDIYKDKFGLNKATLLTSGMIGAIGSYPFSMFIQEEAIQTLGFALSLALKNGNKEAYDVVSQQMKDMLSARDDIINMIPYANSINSLNGYFDAAETYVNVNDEIAEDNFIQAETGETDADKWARVREKEKQTDLEVIDYYNDQRRIMVAFEREAEVQARNDDAAFWRKQREDQSKKEAEDREATAKFWEAYRKRSLEIAESNRPSNLNFGLL